MEFGGPVRLEGVFVCVRCNGELTELKVVENEGTVCADEVACELVWCLGE